MSDALNRRRFYVDETDEIIRWQYLDDEDRALLQGLSVGEHVYTGGGAAPEFRIERLTDDPALVLADRLREAGLAVDVDPIDIDDQDQLTIGTAPHHMTAGCEACAVVWVNRREDINRDGETRYTARRAWTDTANGVVVTDEDDDAGALWTDDSDAVIAFVLAAARG